MLDSRRLFVILALCVLMVPGIALSATLTEVVVSNVQNESSCDAGPAVLRAEPDHAAAGCRAEAATMALQEGVARGRGRQRQPPADTAVVEAVTDVDLEQFTVADLHRHGPYSSTPMRVIGGARAWIQAS